MQRVLLQDDLARFGPIHEYHNLRAPVDAIKLLCINYPEFTKHLIESKENGIGYKVVQAGTDLELEDMLLPFGSNDLIITPVITGSGKGGGRILAGIGLIGLAVVSGGVGLGLGGSVGFGTLGGASTISAAIAIGGNVGIALTLGGISQSLSPQPQIATPRFTLGSETGGPHGARRGVDDGQSYAFRGPTNSIGIGATIPVCYGRALVGSHLVSANIEITDESDPLKRWIRNPDPSQPGYVAPTVNGETLTAAWKSMGGSAYGRTYTNKNADLDPYYDGNRQNPAINDATKDIPFSGVGTYTWSARFDDGSYPASKAQTAIELNNGLFKYISGPGSTKVDGFIKFRIRHFTNATGQMHDAGVYTFTVQGLVAETGNYRFVLQYPIAPILYDWIHEVWVNIEDYSCETGVNTLSIRRVGTHIVPSA
jgi:predicted phage tail protein